MKIKPRVISLNETWIKHGYMDEFNCLSDYVLISNSREKSPGGGVAFYSHKSLSFNVNSKYTLMHEKNFESLLLTFYYTTIRNSLLELHIDHQIKNPAQMLSLLTP